MAPPKAINYIHVYNKLSKFCYVLKCNEAILLITRQFMTETNLVRVNAMQVTVKVVLMVVHSNKMECFSYKGGCTEAF